MPVERILLTTAPPSPEDWLAAFRGVEPDGVVQVLPHAAAQLATAGGAVLATVTLPRRIDAPGEVRRLLDLDAGDRPWWTDVVATAEDPRLTEVVGAVADRLGGLVV